ncbi:MAG: hypothetical protein ABI851_04190 [Saprospiraceae bacterium]
MKISLRVQWLIVFIISIPIIIILRKNFVSSILENKKLVCAYIYKIESYKSNCRVYYITDISGIYEEDMDIVSRIEIEDKLKYLNKYLPLVYDSTNFKNRILILNESELEEWHLSIEDWNGCKNMPPKK